MSVGRHPLAGMAACFAGVGAIFGGKPDPGPDRCPDHGDHERGARRGRRRRRSSILANYWFSLVSSIVLALVAYDHHRTGRRAAAGGVPTGRAVGAPTGDLHRGRRGRRSKTVPPRGGACASPCSASWPSSPWSCSSRCPPGAPLRDPDHRRHHRQDAVHGQPAVHHRDVLAARGGSAYGDRRQDIQEANDVIAAVVKTFAGLAGLVFMLLLISQFIAYFNYSNLPSVLAIALAEWLHVCRDRGAAAADRDDRRDPAPRRDHAGADPEVGDLRPDLHPAVHPARRCRPRPGLAAYASATRR